MTESLQCNEATRIKNLKLDFTSALILSDTDGDLV